VVPLTRGQNSSRKREVSRIENIMEYQNRIKEHLEHPKELSDDEIRLAAAEIFGDLTECFAVVGYSKGSGRKFALKFVENQLCDDALEPLSETIIHWLNLNRCLQPKDADENK